MGANSFLLEKTPFQEKGKTTDRVVSPESVSIPLNPSPAEPGYALPLQTV